ncbi:MAG: type II toxin-antitoxin system HipA family toxin [Wenzhouxiangella sp.]|nr:MAG: type II toxin-antitoxin system HipA family toxin [Wenzhouxiangella sp.]
MRLETSRRGRHVMSGMRYRSAWLQHPARYSLNPMHAPLGATPVEWGTGHIPALIDEVLPGRWERAVRQRFWAGRADIDDLHAVLGDSRSVWRIGAMEILPPDHPQPALSSQVRMADIKGIMDEVKRTEAHLDPDLAALARLQAGSSAGGARPKVTIEHEGAWLAKFSRSDDAFCHPRVEHACLLLAGRAGLEVPESRVETVSGKDLLLVRRFDVSEHGGRRGMVSANALLKDPRQQRDPGHAGYEDVIGCVRRLSSRVEKDLKQLYAQMLFNEAINNRDDHLKNFSFILEPGSVELSPAYDLVPSEAVGAFPQLDFKKRPALPVPATDEAVGAGSAFGLTTAEARQINDRIAAALADIRSVMDEAGLEESDRRFLIQRLPIRFRQVGLAG